MELLDTGSGWHQGKIHLYLLFIFLLFKNRLLGSLVFVVVLFIVTLVMVKVDSDTWQLEFLVVTLAVVVLLNIFSATFQGGLFGLAGCFPPRHFLTHTSS